MALLFALVGCNKESVVPPAPPTLTVLGTVTNEDGQPLKSIQVTVFLPEILYNKNEYKDGVYVCYTEDNGQYSGGLTCHPGVLWPEEITVSAKDTSGVYEAQTIGVLLDIYNRYPDGQRENIIDAKATADFVLHKK